MNFEEFHRGCPLFGQCKHERQDVPESWCPNWYVVQFIRKPAEDTDYIACIGIPSSTSTDTSKA